VARRIVGMDLGVTSAHHAVVIDETCAVLARARARPTAESLAALERRALEGAPEGAALEVVIDPTGPAWLPVAVFFAARGHRLYRPSVEQTAHLRRALAKRKKTNRTCAEVLAKLAVWNAGALHELELPLGKAAELDRAVRATERLTEEVAARKRRIRDLARMLMPTVDAALSRTIGRADLEVLRSYGDLGALPFEVVAGELAAEIARLEVAEAALRPFEGRREEAYRAVDPAQLARSLPGLARVGAPLAVAFTARAARFPSADRYASYVGLVPGSSETGETDRKGQPMTKAGNRKLRRAFVRAADTARKLDPQLARIYFVQMVERGAHHTKALSVVAAHLARRFWATMVRGTPYVVRDVDGRPVSPAEARAIIATRYTVPEEVRARRRSKKGRRAVPHQALVGHVSGVGPRGATQPRRRPSAPDMLPIVEDVVNRGP